jgi:L-serine deaminase
MAYRWGGRGVGMVCVPVAEAVAVAAVVRVNAGLCLNELEG